MAMGEVGCRTGLRLLGLYDAAPGATQRASGTAGSPHRWPHRVLQDLLYTVHVCSPAILAGGASQGAGYGASEGASQGVIAGCTTGCSIGRVTEQV